MRDADAFYFFEWRG